MQAKSCAGKKKKKKVNVKKKIPKTRSIKKVYKMLSNPRHVTPFYQISFGAREQCVTNVFLLVKKKKLYFVYSQLSFRAL